MSRFLEYITEKMGKVQELKTKKDKTGHIHSVRVDAKGNGTTFGYYDHDHPIFEWNIQPSKGHIHDIDIKGR